MDEVDFVNAARGGPDNSMIYMRLGPVPLLIMPYLGALKAWPCSRLLVLWRFGFDHPSTGNSDSRIDPTDFFSAHEIARWSCLGDHHHVDNGG